MNLLDGASKRLRELSRAGVAIPWDAAGLGHDDVRARLDPHAAEMPRSARAAADPPHPADAPVAPPRPAPMVDIDLERLRSQGYLVPDAATSMAAEEFRQIKRAVLGNVVRDGADDRSALIMVTSAVPGEGKTFCAVNLAMSIAMEVDTSVLLVDGDVLRPSVFDRLGLNEPRLGLLDVLVDPELPVSDVMLRTNVPKLSLLPTGTPNIHASERLASGAMLRLLDELVSRYPDRVVVFDTPPLLVSSGTAALARRMGQVLMVVESAATSRREIAQAFAAVEDCPHVMSVLNRCDAPSRRTAYGYYYGYGAGASAARRGHPRAASASE